MQVGTTSDRSTAARRSLARRSSSSQKDSETNDSKSESLHFDALIHLYLDPQSIEVISANSSVRLPIPDLLFPTPKFVADGLGGRRWRGEGCVQHRRIREGQ